MKKLFTMLSLLLVCSACSDKDDSASTPQITLSSDDPAVMVILDGGSALVHLPDHEVVIHIESNSEVGVKSDADWCEAILSGNQISIKALSDADADRRAVVSLTGNGVVLGKLIVTQSANPMIEVETNELESPSEGETRILAVSTNQKIWSASCDADWITAVPSAGKLTLTVNANTAGERTGVVTLAAGQGDNRATATVTITQASNALIFEYTLPDPACTVILPLDGKSNVQIDWGDGTKSSHETTLTSPLKHTYELPGVYNVYIIGTTSKITHGGVSHSDTSRSYLTAVKAWGNPGVISMENAFYNCKKLTSIPENTQNSFKDVTTFKYAFWHAPIESIPASLLKGCSKATLMTYCFSDTQITEIPEGLFDEIPNATDFNTCFSSNTKLTKIPATLFANLPKASNMSACFQLCPALTEIPAGLFKNCVAPKMNDMFYGCKALTKVPDELFSGCSASTTFANSFQNCTALTSVGNNVFKGCTQVTTYGNLFFSCTALESVPANIFDDSKKVTGFGGTFRNCTKLAVESPYTLVEGNKVHLYERSLNTAVFTKPTTTSGCFYGCTALTDWTTINTNYTTWR